jgi:hypothetical protein
LSLITEHSVSRRRREKKRMKRETKERRKEKGKKEKMRREMRPTSEDEDSTLPPYTRSPLLLFTVHLLKK